MRGECSGDRECWDHVDLATYGQKVFCLAATLNNPPRSCDGHGHHGVIIVTAMIQFDFGEFMRLGRGLGSGLFLSTQLALGLVSVLELGSGFKLGLVE